MQTTYFSCAMARTCLLQSLLQCSLSDSLALESQHTLKLLESWIIWFCCISGAGNRFLFVPSKNVKETALCCCSSFDDRASGNLEKTLWYPGPPQRMEMLHPKRFTWQPQQLWKPSFCEKLRDTRNSSSHKMINIILYLNNKPREIECKIGN